MSDDKSLAGLDKVRGIALAWAAGESGDKLSFPAAVTVTDLAGKAGKVPAGQAVALTRAPVFVTDLPTKTLAAARAQGDKPFPWLKDFASAETVSVTMGQANVTGGLAQLEQGDGKTVVGLVDGIYVRRTDRAKKMYYMYFDVDDSYASVGDKELDITIVARRVYADKNAGCNIVYESATGYRNLGEWWTVPAGEGWQKHTFHITNANFANNWGWNFRIEAVSSPDDMWVKEVTVRRIGAKK